MRLLLRADEAELRGLGQKLGLLRAEGVRAEREAFTFLLAPGVSRQAEWSYDWATAWECRRLFDSVKLAPPAPLPGATPAVYRRQLRRLRKVEAEESLLWRALGAHVADRTQFVEVSEPLALAYMRAKELLRRARREFAQEKVALLEAGEAVATLELSLTYLADRLEGLASTQAGATVKAGDPAHRAVDRVVDAMEEHLELLRVEKQQLAQARVESASLEYSDADEYMVNLLKRQPHLQYRQP